ncbi:hypothetical protein Tco_0268036 [Tanacetum coccineum]
MFSNSRTSGECDVNPSIEERADLFLEARIVWYEEPKFLIQMHPKRSEGEELEYLFFEGDSSSSDEWGDYGMAGDDYEGPPVFDDDQYEEELMSIYDTDIEDVIDGEEDREMEKT